MNYRRIISLSELEDGWYWCRGYKFIMCREVRNGKIWCEDEARWEALEGIGGEWAGPIPMPEEWKQLLDDRDYWENRCGNRARVITELRSEIATLKAKDI